MDIFLICTLALVIALHMHFRWKTTQTIKGMRRDIASLQARTPLEVVHDTVGGRSVIFTSYPGGGWKAFAADNDGQKEEFLGYCDTPLAGRSLVGTVATS
jgi:hypothetical protein